MNPILATALGGAIGYLLGGIPFGLIVGRLAGVGDVRQYGSGKTGFTNSLRTMGVKWAIIVVLGDAAKGGLAVVLARLLFDEPGAAALAGAAAVFGHIFPVFAGFRGGRGVATAFGAFLAVSPIVALIVLGASLAILALFRYASLMSVTGVFVGFVVLGIMWAIDSIDGKYFLLFAIPTMFLVEVSHTGNIRRLLAGTEPKLGQGGGRRPAGTA
ncbi:MAG: glycerol-3-phosphate 1-O-acyltransferase PlsY [Dehalococcoidia bacterium]|nr:glycerol-3-phosphate 1-O-acyltransferase PlsY [Dehalococcoidia bacterium]